MEKKNWSWFNNDENRKAGLSKAIYTKSWANRVAKKLKEVWTEVEVVDLGYGNYAVKFLTN